MKERITRKIEEYKHAERIEYRPPPAETHIDRTCHKWHGRHANSRREERARESVEERSWRSNRCNAPLVRRRREAEQVPECTPATARLPDGKVDRRLEKSWHGDARPLQALSPAPARRAPRGQPHARFLFGQAFFRSAAEAYSYSEASLAHYQDSWISRCVSGIAFCQGRFSGLQGWCSIWGAQAVIPLVVYSKFSVPFWFQRAPFPAVLCHFQNPAGPEQLQHVADRAHQLPLAADILFATQAEGAKTAPFLALSEVRLDDRLAHLVHGAASLGS